MKESVTLAALTFLAGETGQSVSDVLKDFGEYLRRSRFSVILEGPMLLTVRNPTGTFSKAPFIGDEEFFTEGAYMGRREGVILKVRLEGFEGRVSEIPAHVAEKELRHYQSCVDCFVNSYGLEEDQTMIEEGKKREEEAHAVAILQSRVSDERFGSW